MIILGVVLVLLAILPIAAIPFWLFWIGLVLIVAGVLWWVVPAAEGRTRRRLY